MKAMHFKVVLLEVLAQNCRNQTVNDSMRFHGLVNELAVSSLVPEKHYPELYNTNVYFW